MSGEPPKPLRMQDIIRAPRGEGPRKVVADSFTQIFTIIFLSLHMQYIVFFRYYGSLLLQTISSKLQQIATNKNGNELQRTQD